MKKTFIPTDLVSRVDKHSHVPSLVIPIKY